MIFLVKVKMEMTSTPVETSVTANNSPIKVNTHPDDRCFNKLKTYTVFNNFWRQMRLEEVIK